MFTGIVETVGVVRSLRDSVLVLERPVGFEDLQIGESIAVDGCCLTLVPGEGMHFDLSPETLARTTLGAFQPGRRVNLERAMPADGRFGGHIVQGHVDGLARVTAKRVAENATVLSIQASDALARYLIDKGSVALDGISLTVVEPQGGRFDLWLIPHTLEVTNLGEREVGDGMNMEADVLAKYAEGLLNR